MASITYVYFVPAKGLIRDLSANSSNIAFDIRPHCHHHFDVSGTSNAMFDELAERSLIRKKMSITTTSRQIQDLH